jgi:hypothetical protein
MDQEMDLGSHHATELLFGWVRCFLALLAVLLIKHEPRLHWHFLWLKELAMVLTILFKELCDICIKMKLIPSSNCSTSSPRKESMTFPPVKSKSAA